MYSGSVRFESCPANRLSLMEGFSGIPQYHEAITTSFQILSNSPVTVPPNTTQSERVSASYNKPQQTNSEQHNLCRCANLTWHFKLM